MTQTFVVNSQITNVEDVFHYIGGFGRFQVGILVILLSFEIPVAWVAFTPVFTGVSPEEWMCDNVTVFKSDPDFCNLNCTVLTTARSSIVSEWGLICNLSWVSDFITTLQMLGMLFGNLITGQCADWYGRRLAILGAVFWLSFGTILSIVSPNVYVYAISRFICGLGFSGYIFLSMTYAMEFVTPNRRSICSSVGPFGEGIMLLGVIGYYFQDSWRNLLMFTVIPFTLFIIVFPFLLESPRWLLQRKRIEEAHKIFNTISKINRASPKIDIETLWRITDFDQNIATEKVKKIGYVEFFKNKDVRYTTFFLSLIWQSWAIMYFGISYSMKNFGGDPFLNIVLMGLCDAIGYPISYFMNSILTRRRSVAIFMTASAVFLVSLAILQFFLELSTQSYIVLVFCLLGKFFAAAGRASLRILTGESFPTDVRNMGFGIVGVSASVSALIAPQLAFLGSRWPSAPLFAFGLCSLLGALASFFLRETKDQPLCEGMSKEKTEISNE